MGRLCLEVQGAGADTPGKGILSGAQSKGPIFATCPASPGIRAADNRSHNDCFWPLTTLSSANWDPVDNWAQSRNCVPPPGTLWGRSIWKRQVCTPRTLSSPLPLASAFVACDSPQGHCALSSPASSPPNSDSLASSCQPVKVAKWIPTPVRGRYVMTE